MKLDNELDREEQEILEAFERGEMRSVAGVEDEIAAARRAARATVRHAQAICGENGALANVIHQRRNP